MDQTKKSTICSVTFFHNGQNMCFDSNGNQIPELQEPWIILWAKLAESYGYDITQIKDIMVPNGSYVKFFKTESGYNWATSDSINHDNQKRWPKFKDHEK